MTNVFNIQKQSTALTTIQNRFALLDLSSEIRVIDLQQVADVMSGKSNDVSFYKRTEGFIVISRELENLPFPVKAAEEFKNFTVNPNTRLFNALAFSPLLTPATTLNYWTGPLIKPAQGDWFVIQEFLHTVICNNNIALFDYLIHYLAHMLQHPEEKPGIMIVFLSGQGTGKGTFYKLLDRIWSRTTLQVSDIAEVVGQFNAALERNYVICMDEALFHGDKKSLEKLKSLITEPKCRIEQKYQPSRTIDSFHRLFASSNKEHFAQVDKDDRRFLFIRVSSVHKQDQRYFDAINDALENDDVISAMMHDLQNLDLTDFNIRQRPITSEHVSQRLQSLHGFERFWFEVLSSGRLPSKWDGHNEWHLRTFISTESLIHGYKEYDKSATRYQPLQSQQLAAKLKALCPSVLPTRRTLHNNQERGYELPELQTARMEFEDVMQTEVEWDEIDI